MAKRGSATVEAALATGSTAPAIVEPHTKAGHRYSLLGHASGGAVAVDPHLITLHEEATPYVGFQHEGMEFIYMLTGEVVYPHADQSYHLRPGDAMLFDSAALHGPKVLFCKPMTYLSIIVHTRKQD